MSNIVIHVIASVGGLAGGFFGAWLGVRVSHGEAPFPAEAAEALSQGR